MALPANPASPSSPFQSPTEWFAEHSQRSHRNTPHGQKRRIDDEADTSSPAISSGFKKLRISPPRRPRRPEHGYYTDVDQQYTHHRTTSPIPTYHSPTVTHDHDLTDPPISHEPIHHQLQPAHHHTLHHPRPLKHHTHLLPTPQPRNTPPPQRLPTNHADFMPIEDSRHRIFISDLDAAIAEIEAEELAAKEKEQEAAFFLPDEVDKELSSIPDQVLRRSNTATTAASHPAATGASQALVLYRDPLSISVPEEADAVRKAVHEARQRMRERSSGQQVGEGHEGSISPPVATEPLPPSSMAVDHETFGYPLDRQQAEWRHGGNDALAENCEFDPDAMEIE
jgi:hypothetical protein